MNDFAEGSQRGSVCAACGLPILDRYVLFALDKPWHAACLRCFDCSRPQDESCFFRDGKILCRNDFFRRFGVKCAGCDATIGRQELVRRARDRLYHCRCFRCSACSRPLNTGEQLYVVEGSKFLCESDYISSSLKDNRSEVRGSSICQNHESEDDVDGSLFDHGDTATVSNESNSGNEDVAGRADENQLSQKRRGPRTTIKAKQLETLKAAFASTPKPTRHIREQLAAETGLNMRVIQVWFQNRRSKERRMKQVRFNGNYRSNRRSRHSHGISAINHVDMSSSNFIKLGAHPAQNFNVQQPDVFDGQMPHTVNESQQLTELGQQPYSESYADVVGSTFSTMQVLPSEVVHAEDFWHQPSYSNTSDDTVLILNDKDRGS